MAKGQTNNPNGRPKGIPNRITGEMRVILKDILAQELDRIPEYLNSIESGKDRLEVLLKLMPYVFPKVSNVWWKEDEPTSKLRDSVFDSIREV